MLMKHNLGQEQPANSRKCGGKDQPLGRGLGASQRDGMGDLEWPIRLPPDQRDGRECELHGPPRGLEGFQELLPTVR